MITVSPNTKVYIHTTFIDFRNGIDGICAICKYQLHRDPFSGAMFIFTNRGRTALKILFYDGQGFWVYHKRLSRGKFKWWPNGDTSLEMASRELNVLLWNGDPQKSKMQEDWRPILT